MTDRDDISIEEQLDQLRQETRRSKRRLRLVAGALLAVVLAVNVAPVAANHLTVRTSDIDNGAVTTSKLRNGAVGTAKLKNGAAGTAKLKNGAVGRKKIKPNSIGPGKMRPYAITAHAHGHITENGLVVADESRNLTDSHIARIGVGEYCFHDLPFDAINAVVTPSSTPTYVSVRTDAFSMSGCPVNTSFIVRTEHDFGTIDRDFRIVIFAG